MVNPVFRHVHGVRGPDVFAIYDIASGVRARDHSGLGAREVVVVDVSGAVSVLMVPAKALSAVGSHSEASFRGTSGIDSTDAKSVGTTMSSHTPVLSRIVGLVDLWGGVRPAEIGALQHFLWLFSILGKATGQIPSTNDFL